MSINLKVFIGWDSREPIAYDVARASILRHNPNIEVVPVKRDELIAQGIFTREADQGASTEFTMTRFFIPYLSNYEGYSLFMDCDMVLTTDIAKILDDANLTNAVSCVQHDYDKFDDLSDEKMDGQKQVHYPRKNWSSVMLFNNAACKELTLDYCNTASAKDLHRMNWASSVGELHHRWNYLAGYYKDNDYNLIHWTDGGPWFENYRDCPLNHIWYNELFYLFGIHDRYDSILENLK